MTRLPLNRQPVPSRNQRGVGAVFVVAFVAMALVFVVVIAKIVPTYGEYGRVQRVLKDIAATNAVSAAEVRAAFDSRVRSEGITSIAAEAIEVSREGDSIVIAFAYAREVSLAGPLSLLVRYDGKVRKPARSP